MKRFRKWIVVWLLHRLCCVEFDAIEGAIFCITNWFHCFLLNTCFQHITGVCDSRGLFRIKVWHLFERVQQRERVKSNLFLSRNSLINLSFSIDVFEKTWLVRSLALAVGYILLHIFISRQPSFQKLWAHWMPIERVLRTEANVEWNEVNFIDVTQSNVNKTPNKPSDLVYWRVSCNIFSPLFDPFVQFFYGILCLFFSQFASCIAMSNKRNNYQWKKSITVMQSVLTINCVGIERNGPSPFI